MEITKELWDYFAAHSVGRTTEKRALETFIEFTKDVDEGLLALILRKVQAEKFYFSESKSAYVSPYWKKICFPYRSESRFSAFHELGHVVDFLSGDCTEKPKKNGGKRICYNARWHTNEYRFSSGQTLDEIVRNEIKTNEKRLLRELLECLNREVLEELKVDGESFLSYGVLCAQHSHLVRKYKRMKDWECDEAQTLKADIRKLEAEIDTHMEAKTTVHDADAFAKFVKKYRLLCDIVSGCYDTSYFLPSHSRSYMQAPGGFGAEFFAEMFASMAIGDDASLQRARTWLPASCAAFSELLQHLLADVRQNTQSAVL